MAEEEAAAAAPEAEAPAETADAPTEEGTQAEAEAAAGGPEGDAAAAGGEEAVPEKQEEEAPPAPPPVEEKQPEEEEEEGEMALPEDDDEGFEDSIARQMRGLLSAEREAKLLERIKAYDTAARKQDEADAQEWEEERPLSREELMQEMKEDLAESQGLLMDMRTQGGGFSATEERIRSEMDRMQDDWERQKAQIMEDLSEKMQAMDQNLRDS